ncbi:MAG: hypothetical protein ABWY78_06395 [Microvirga sp.]
MAKNFDPATSGQRIRIGFTRYNASRRYFEHLKNTAIVVTVVDSAERRRLIHMIETVVQERKWTHAGDSSGADPADPAEAVVQG